MQNSAVPAGQNDSAPTLDDHAFVSQLAACRPDARGWIVLSGYELARVRQMLNEEELITQWYLSPFAFEALVAKLRDLIAQRVKKELTK